VLGDEALRPFDFAGLPGQLSADASERQLIPVPASDAAKTDYLLFRSRLICEKTFHFW
jgi:hypothetical protein